MNKKSIINVVQSELMAMFFFSFLEWQTIYFHHMEIVCLGILYNISS